MSRIDPVEAGTEKWRKTIFRTVDAAKLSFKNGFCHVWASVRYPIDHYCLCVRILCNSGLTVTQKEINKRKSELWTIGWRPMRWPWMAHNDHKSILIQWPLNRPLIHTPKMHAFAFEFEWKLKHFLSIEMQTKCQQIPQLSPLRRRTRSPASRAENARH